MTKTKLTACYYCTKDVPVRRFVDYDGPHWICAECLRAWADTDTDEQWRAAREDVYLSHLHKYDDPEP